MLNLSETYFGFTDNKKPMQAAKIEKTLDKLWRFDGEVMAMKKYVFLKLQEGSKPGYEENYSYYSKRLNDYTKPKTLYKLMHEDDCYTEITKTAYEYANYLLKNNLTDEDNASQFIINETKEKEEKEKLEREKEQKKREEQEAQREKEEMERKEALAKKRKKWFEIGEKVVSNFESNPIMEVLDNNWKEIKSIYVDEEKEVFYDNMIQKFTEMLGNESYCAYWLKFYINNENNQDLYKNDYTLRNNPMRKLEKEILFKAFSNVSVEDKDTTITAKVKAVFENREYKGGKAPKQHKFYYVKKDPETMTSTFVEAYGQKIIIDNIECYVRKEDGKYIVTEAKTGLSIGGFNSNKNKAISIAKELIKKNREKMEQFINKQIERNGVSPLFQEQKAI